MATISRGVMCVFCELFVATIIATLLSVVAAFGGAHENQEATQWASKANQIMDVCSPGSPPFRLIEDIKVWTKDNQWVAGTYTLIWQNPDAWRDELALPDYHEIRVGGKQSISFLRSQPYWTPAALHARPLAGVTRFVSRVPTFGVTRTHDTVRGRVNVHCFSGKPIRSIKAEGCFDADRGFFLSSADSASSGIIRTEFADYVNLGEHFIPRQTRDYRDDRLVGEVDIREASLTHEADSGAFAPPAGATRIGGCLLPGFPKPIAMPSPGRRRAKVSGTVALEVKSDTQGSIEDVVVVEPLDPSLDSKAVETIKKEWRFQPATCSGVPVPLETVVLVDFLRSLF